MRIVTLVTALVALVFVTVTTADEPDIDINHADVDTPSDEKVPGHEGTITVHVVAHTHDDVGWLKTVDQYYYGSKDDIYKGGVQYIIDTVIEQLVKDPKKKFIYVEIAFFKRWWEEQDKETRQQVRNLVKGGQLEFINAGYCMNDEASVHYAATIDQMSEGLMWLQREVGGPDYDVTPTIAWQIDPFGHSSAHAALSAQMGMKGLFFARMHYQDYDKRKRNKDLEFNWKVENGNLFTGVLYRQHYNAPPGFDFDRRRADPPMVRNPQSPEYNIPERVEDFVSYLEEQSSHYRSGNIMLTMGGDFCYQNAHKYFKNLDILMDYVNANTTNNGFKMIYSTPSQYMDAVLKSIGGLQNKTDDLFPYADGPHSYWTGYFTSRPTLKGYVRDCNNVLQVCKHVEAAAAPGDKLGATSELLRLAMGVSQHHDAVSGTSKQHVADDYARRLAAGQTECETLITKGLKMKSVYTGKLHACRLLNESYCEVTQDGNRSLTIVVYNARVTPRIEYIRIPLTHPHYHAVNLVTQQYMPVEYLRVSAATRALNPDSLPLEGVFRAELPPLGFASFELRVSLNHVGRVLKSVPVYYGEDLMVESQIYKVYFDSRTGAMKMITNKLAGLSGRSDKLTQRFMEYSSSPGDKVDNQPSGAYIFRPLNNSPDDLGDPILTDYIPGELFTEVWQTFDDWITQVTRIYYDKFHIEVEWTVGPIPLDHGREIITRYDTSLATNKTFYTDSNGREMVERVLNKQPTWDLTVTEPIAGNYYPVNTRATIVDSARGMQLTVLTDRSQGAASLGDGQVEFMVHRRILNDDHRGVGEPLNETANGRGLIVRGRHWLFYSDTISYHMHRDVGLDLFYKPTVVIGNEGGIEVPTWNFYKSATPASQYLNIVTLQKIPSVNGTDLLVRLENTLPGSEGGKPITVKLDDIFGVEGNFNGYQELGLAADRDIKKVVDYKSHTQHDDAAKHTIELQPFQIRTFILNFNSTETMF
ncbi:lysosomal alpha-mannosidase-like isoform X2 [Bolinopsis microptera]|uniref:lysosomal alpha-mannosidase-like isoform X2 n=1 Tax=Bolinopsis microptera TaxID=2820187 RepID=UPI00307A9D68